MVLYLKIYSYWWFKYDETLCPAKIIFQPESLQENIYGYLKFQYSINFKNSNWSPFGDKSEYFMALDHAVNAFNVEGF